MIEGISVTNEKNQTLELSLRDYESQGLIIVSIDGLTPVKADINTAEMVAGDGSTFGSARISERNITMQLKLLDSPSMEITRRKLYSFFGVKRKIRLSFTNESGTFLIDGYVESNEINIFTSSEVANISIICPEPYFREATKQVTYFYGDAPRFEFPFPEDRTAEGIPESMVELGTVNITAFNHVHYVGDVNVGAEFEIKITGKLTGFALTNVVTYEKLTIDDEKLKAMFGTEHSLYAGDVITFNTVRNHKSIMLLRDGKQYNILNCIAKDTDWFELIKGDNVFLYTVSEGERNAAITVTNNILYEGI